MKQKQKVKNQLKRRIGMIKTIMKLKQKVKNLQKKEEWNE